jgi:hypothetical protein
MTHRIVQTTYVNCNGPGCNRVESWQISASQKTAGTVLRRDGWHLRPGNRHICPPCWEKGER